MSRKKGFFLGGFSHRKGCFLGVLSFGRLRGGGNTFAGCLWVMSRKKVFFLGVLVMRRGAFWGSCHLDCDTLPIVWVSNV